MARITFDASQHDMLDVHSSESTDRGVTLRRTLSFLELIREEVKQRTFRVRQYAVLESLYQGATGWRQALIFRLLHRFGDPMYLEAQHADEQEQQCLRELGFDYEPPGEPEHQELLRLLEEEIASVREEFEYAEKMNEERAAIERDACLAPEGETWKMMLRQEGALDRSIDRKVRILLSLRKESSNLQSAPFGQDDGTRTENFEVLDGDISSRIFVGAASGARGHGQDARVTAGGTPALQGVFQSAAMKCLKMTERSGNVYENKGSAFHRGAQSWNVTENKVVVC